MGISWAEMDKKWTNKMNKKNELKNGVKMVKYG